MNNGLIIDYHCNYPSIHPPNPQILGIMNGTTNFMLTKMEGGADYGEVLAEAQALGYAEGK